MPKVYMLLGRELKRVPMDFSYPINTIWAGYCNPFYWAKDLNLSSKTKEKYYEYFKKIEPPNGEGYQCWETVSEGSPISPVFKSLEELSQWLADNPMGITDKMSKNDWLEALQESCPMIDITTKEKVKQKD